MTWICPYCGNSYPDSSIGLPSDADAEDKTHCERCDTTVGEGA